MNVGVQLFASLGSEQEEDLPLHRAVELAVMAEQLGFDAVWTAEHHATAWNICPDPLLLLAYIAARTERIRLGTAVVNLTLHHPVEVAERARLVDALSQGRLELGIGRGFAAADYALYGIDTARKDEIFAQHHERLARALAREEAPLRPLGAQRPWPPIWLATTGNQRSIELAAKRGYGLLVAGTAEKLESGLAAFRRQWGVGQSQPPRVAVTGPYMWQPANTGPGRRWSDRSGGT
jgi:alkanesulfonate monooxygenase SsuD/methylene tetrahydromethanopterin reductase-like flavin-dependent oxidoreductase (luciferase family)